MKKTSKEKNLKFFFGFAIITFLFLFMILGLILCKKSPNETDIANKLQFFSASHFLGTDNLGRDVFARLLIALKVSFIIGFVSATFALVFGTFLGSVSGYFLGITDFVIKKIIDLQMAFPGILLALMIAAVLGASFESTLFALTIMLIPRFARISRGGAIKLKNSNLVLALKARGASSFRIIFVHILPNIKDDLIVTYALSFAFAIMNESGLSYLGLGIQPPNASFGKMLYDGQSCIFVAPHLILVPTVVLALLVTGFMLMSDGITSKKMKNTYE